MNVSAIEQTDAKVGQLFGQLTPHDMAYYCAAVQYCADQWTCTNAPGCDTVLRVLHGNYGLPQQVTADTINFDAVCQLLCARGLRVLDLRRLGFPHDDGLISVRWGDKRCKEGPLCILESEAECKVYIPISSTASPGTWLAMIADSTMYPRV